MANQPHHLAAGKQAERLAEQYLVDKGLKLVERNFSCKPGEIDLIMRDRQDFVFVEVRYRQSTRFGRPEETVSPAKQRKLGKAAACYLLVRGLNDKYACRFDIIAIHGTIPNHTINWIPDAFYATS